MIEKKRRLFIPLFFIFLTSFVSGESGREKMIKFSGDQWIIKSSVFKVGPGPNRFSSRSITREGDSIILSIEGKNKRWYSGEIYSDRLFSYGTFRLTFSITEPLDSNAVFGFFLYNDTAPPYYNEIDFEIARWGIPGLPPYNFTVQPYDVEGNSHSFHSTAAGLFSCIIRWEPGILVFRLEDGQANTLESWEYRGEAAPVETESRVHFNLWLFQGESPLNDGGLTAGLHSFEYLPFEP